MKTHLLGGLTLLAAIAVACPASAHDEKAKDHDDLAVGEPGDPTVAGIRTVEVLAREDAHGGMSYSIEAISVAAGEQVRFVVTNVGELPHELVLGTAHENQEHYELMIRFPEMEHEDPNMVQVEPGQTAELVWKFSKAGTFEFACLHPGHYEAGMKGAIAVE